MKKLKKFLSSKSAFSLIELSVVLVIIAILLSGTLSVSRTAIQNAQYKETQEKMTTIVNALNTFLRTSRRLPCPAPFSIIKTTSTYGIEGSTPGTCTGTYSAFTTNTGSNTNLVYGMVPTQSLGLGSDMAEDGFGTRFSYVVDKRFTLAASTTSTSNAFETTNGSSGTIVEIRELDDATSYTTATTKAIFALISHGANKYGGWSSSSATYNTASSNDDEMENDATANNDFNSTLVINSTDTAFDDMIIFKEKSQMIYEAGLVGMICAAGEGSYTCGAGGSVTLTNNAYYKADSTFTCPANCTGAGGNGTRECSTYGVWIASDDCT